MTITEIREKFLNYFKSKGHTIVPSSSLLPDDPSVLFTTAGMQQFKPYYTGKADPMKDFGSLNTVSIQKSIRTSDIDEVGDATHLTFFEMLGNFSFGGYFKKEAIKYAYEFVTKEMELKIDYVSVFGGEGDVPADTESEEIWKSIDPDITVKKFGRADNFWGPTGDEGPCGPTTEIYVDGVEIWNIVFNQYYQQKDTKLELLKTLGIDTGMGLERLVRVVQGVPTIFETDLFQPIMKLLPESLNQRTQRIVADHVRAIAFLISDGITPSNKDQGYILRRLMRRVIVHKELNFSELINEVIKTYGTFYPELDTDKIIAEFDKEKEKFSKTLDTGLKVILKGPVLDAASTFKIYESFGVPYEVVKDVGKTSATPQEIEIEFKKHQEKSRAGAEKKFGGHGLLLDTGELKAANEEELKKVTRLHTATHLLQAALRKVLGDTVTQAGSDITAERLRFDFTFPRKLTPEEIQQVEEEVNAIVEKDLPVTKQTLSQEEAKKTGALHFFKIKYPDMVDVYSIEGFSKEFCGGPHIGRTSEIGKFKITKEEAVSAGVRRIRANVE
jgi:alanyl-tRNA synthetase